MSCSDCISIICASVSLVVTIVIAVLQIRQSSNMNKFERRQDERDEQRHAESVRAQAVSFISRFYSDRGLIPLCAIAAMYNDLFYYSREMYREFCCMTREVQNCILKYCNLDLRVREINGLFGKCINALENVLYEKFPDDESPFYDGGKYVLRSLEYYGSELIPVKGINYCRTDPDGKVTKFYFSESNMSFSYEQCIKDVLGRAFDGEGTQQPLSRLEHMYDFCQVNDIEACQFATVLAEQIAIYCSRGSNSDKYYGFPGCYAEETIDTMEDLFLRSLFYMYVYLILAEQK